MAQVRQHLGPEAIIVSTQDDATGTSVTAILDIDDARHAPLEQDSGAIEAIGQELGRHGLAPEKIETILTAALPFDDETPLGALARALAVVFRFAPVKAEEASRPLLLVGPPGAGKTATAAKLAARSVFAGAPVRLVTADTTRAGAADQLAAFARILKIPFHAAANARELKPFAQPADLTFIDGAGINPYSADDRRDLALAIEASGAEPLLVLPAGGDTVDTVAMARIFAEHGCRRFAVTRLDMARRLGGILAAADDADLAFAEAGLAPDIADGLSPVNSVLLARLLLTADPSSKR